MSTQENATETTTTTQAARKWQAIGLGPIQTKRLNKALADFAWQARSYVELTGVVGGPEHRSTLTPFCGNWCASAESLFAEVFDRFNGVVTPAVLAEVLAALATATEQIELPIFDNRRAPDEQAELNRQAAERDAERAAREEKIRATHAAILAKRPAWAEALILAICDQNDSDSMTDYYAHRRVQAVAIGWRRGKREDFRQLRAAAAGFPQTAHLGPGCGVFTVYRAGCERWAGRLELEDGSRAIFTTRAAAEFFIDQRCQAEGAQPAEFEIESEEIEHRENWSMGDGYYLKAGSRHASGWRVESCPVGYALPSLEIEDRIPEPPAPAPATSPEVSASGLAPVGRATITEIYHTKRNCPVFIVSLADRVDRAEFDRLTASAKKRFGWYSRAWNGSPGGWAFLSGQAAHDWAAGEFSSGPLVAATAPPALEGPAPEVASGARCDARGTRLESTATVCDQRAEHLGRPLSQNPTPKRLREYHSRLIDSRNYQRCAELARALATANPADLSGELARLSTTPKLLPLVSRKHHSESYYHVAEGEWLDTSPLAQEARALIGQADHVDRAPTAEELEYAIALKALPGYWPTPAGVAAAMIDHAHFATDLEPQTRPLRVLDTSCGGGVLLAAALERFPTAEVTGLEINYDLCELARARLGKDHASGIVRGDALDPPAAVLNRGPFDLILINPPFEHGASVAHVRAAYELLAPYGRLVALLPQTVWKSDRYRAFVDWAESRILESVDFHQPTKFASGCRSTEISVSIVTIPGEAVCGVHVPGRGVLFTGASS